MKHPSFCYLADRVAVATVISSLLASFYLLDTVAEAKVNFIPIVAVAYFLPFRYSSCSHSHFIPFRYSSCSIFCSQQIQQLQPQSFHPFGQSSCNIFFYLLDTVAANTVISSLQQLQQFLFLVDTVAVATVISSLFDMIAVAYFVPCKYCRCSHFIPCRYSSY